MGGSFGKNNSDSSNQFSSNIWGAQGDALQKLWQNAFANLDSSSSDAVSELAPGASQSAQDIYESAFGGLQEQMSGGAYGDAADLRERLFGMMDQPTSTSQMYKSIVGGEGNEYVDPLIERLRADSSRNVDTLQSGTALDAAMAGQSGSSRHAMENAMIASEANKDLLDKEAELRYGAYDKDLAMKMGIAEQADAAGQSEQDRLLRMITGANESQSGAIDSSRLLQSLAMGSMAPYMQAGQYNWNDLSNLSNIIGSPIMESTGSGSSSSKGKGGGASLFG